MFYYEENSFSILEKKNKYLNYFMWGLAVIIFGAVLYFILKQKKSVTYDKMNVQLNPED